MRVLTLRDPGSKSGRALTIGNFDGVHLGHQAILEYLVAEAAKRNLIPSVLIFQPHPAEFFSPIEAPVRLYGVREKVRSFLDVGIEQVCLLPFNVRYAQMLAEDFVRNVLVKELSVRWLLVGDDFRFGSGRSGDYQMLQNLGRELGFEVEANQSVKIRDMRVSSTAVRGALSSGNLKFAEELLGKRYNMCGRVVRGDQIGRTLGFPTANIHFCREFFPLSGIFTAYVDGPEMNQRPALVSVGKRPTVTSKGDVCIEAYILDFSGDLYGQMLNVTFVRKIRDQETFAGTCDLIAAMKEDEKNARLDFELDVT
jgi:riboflavin kinase/FMN adenylyltransferase